jgi:hypothetical protein
MASDGPVIALDDYVTGKETAVTKFNGSLPPVGMSQFSISPDERFLFVVRADPVFSNIQSVDLAPVEKHLSRAN